MSLTRDDVMKRIREGTPPANREESDDYLRAMGIPELSSELTSALREADEIDVAQTCFIKMLPIFARTLRLIPSLQARCIVCTAMHADEPETAGSLCPMCSEELREFEGIVIDLAKLVRVSNAAYGPGTHASAQREARAEREAAKVASDDDATR